MEDIQALGAKIGLFAARAKGNLERTSPNRTFAPSPFSSGRQSLAEPKQQRSQTPTQPSKRRGAVADIHNPYESDEQANSLKV